MTKADLKELARQLRREGKSYDQISVRLGVAKSSCARWLRDLPRPEPVAPPLPPLRTSLLSAAERRDRARELRGAGALLREIAAELGVTVTTAGSWCAGTPAPPRSRRPDVDRGRQPSPSREARERRREQVHADAAAALGPVTGRDLLLALAVSYWCEGAKAKPWNPQERLRWTNSDPGLVRLFLAGLREAGVPAEHVGFRLSIHARADEEAARSWWAALVGVAPESFARTTLKRHNPRTTRFNADDSYRGCLVVSVRQGRELYQRLDGLVRGVVAACEAEEEGPLH